VPPGRAPGAPDRLFAVLTAVCAANFAFFAVRLLYPDLNLDYPFTDGDSFDWIANGLYLAGHDVRYSGRPPLFPLLLAGLDRLSLLPLAPVLLQLLFHLAILAFYRLAARLHTRSAAFVTALALLLDSSVQSLSLDLMADLAASCLLLFALVAFDRAQEEPRAYLASGLAAAASALTQQAALLAVVPAVVAVVTLRRRHLRSPWLWGGALLFLLPQGLWLLAKRLAFGTAGELLVRYSHLLHLHGSSAGTYLYFLASLLGLPGCLLLAYGLVVALRRAPGSATRLFALGLFAILLGFFVFFYDYNAKRFLLYVLWPAGLFLSEGLARFTDRRAFAAAAALLLAGALVPQPVPGHEGTRVGLWPLPPIYLQAAPRHAPSGSVTLDLHRLRLERHPAADLLRLSSYQRVIDARKARGMPAPFDRSRVRGYRRVLFLYDDPAEGGERYRVVTRLANALGKRVHFVRRSYLAPYSRLLATRPLERVGGEWTLYTARLPGLPGEWLLVTSGPPPFPGDPSQPGLPATSADLQAGLAKARAIRDFVDGSDANVVILSDGGDPSQLYLPFLLGTTELFIPEASQRPGLFPLLAPAPVLAERRFGTTVVRRLRLFGRDSALVSYLP